jgi:acyl-coenzyme A thioesterase PaaI-like protein
MPAMSTAPERGEGRDGLALVEGVRDGLWPADPFMVSLGIRVTEASGGRVVMVATPGDDHRNLGGIVHGGYLSTIMDSAPTATAEVLKAGSRIGHVRVELRDAADRLVATGETTHAVVAVPAAGRPSR